MTESKTTSHWIERVWQPRWLGAVVGASVAALAGVLTAWAMPHGPATALQALLVLFTCLATGVLAGLAMRSRWSLLLAPLAYVLAVELARRSAVGPTVDAIRLNETYGILALILGRGFHGIVGLLPMIFGAWVGVRLARLWTADATAAGSSRAGSDLAGWLPLAAGAAALLALTVLIALPASTPPIRDANGGPLAGSVAELVTLRIGGENQSVLIRGHSVDNPVLLYLAGGPGPEQPAAPARDLPGPRKGLRRRGVGPARNRQVLRRPGPGTGERDAAAGSGRHRRTDQLPAANASTRRRSTCWANPTGRSWACWLRNSGPICTTPSSAAGRWSTWLRPTGGSTRTSWPTLRSPGTPSWQPRCAPMANRPTPTFPTPTRSP